jgi:hypothetical protein
LGLGGYRRGSRRPYRNRPQQTGAARYVPNAIAIVATRLIRGDYDRGPGELDGAPRDSISGSRRVARARDNFINFTTCLLGKTR